MLKSSCMRSKNGVNLGSRGAKWLLLGVGTLIWSLVMVKSGLIYSYGMGFWGANGHDAIWHLALASSLSRFSLEMPVFAGFPIQNYHIGFDLFLAFLHLISQIPLSNLYFQILPPLFAFSIGFLSYQFMYIWKKDRQAAWWATFFVYFGGSFAYVFNSGESLFWSQQAISTLINPPFALSLVFFLLCLLSLALNKQKTAILLFAVLPQIKVYAGILAFAGLFLASLKNARLFKVLFLSSLMAAALYLPLNWNSASLVVFQPLWFLQNLFGSGRLNWPQMFSALQTYYSGHIYVKGALAYGLALLIFLIGNLGTRIVFLASIRLKTWIDYLFLPVLLLGIGFPMLFVQQGTAWNTIQFFYYSLFIAALYAGTAVRKFPAVFQVLIVLLTLPTAYLALQHYLPARPPAMISVHELSALKFLSQQPAGIVYTLPFDKKAADAAASHPPRPLYLYESTAYVAAFSGHPVWLEDTVNLNITGYDWQSRLSHLPSSGITYYYLTKDSHFPNTHLIYSNPEIYIYKAD